MNKVSGLFIIAVAFVVSFVSCNVPSQQATPQFISPLEGLAKTPTPRPTVYAPLNLLLNPSFEGTFVTCGQSCNVAEGWQSWSSETLSPPCIAGKPGCFDCPSNCSNCNKDFGCWWSKAEHKQATLQFPERVNSGESAQQAFTYGRMGEFGIYQIIPNVPAGKVEFAIYVQAWQCYEVGNCQPNLMNLKIGIDPLGGSDPYAETIVWSDTVESFDRYTRLSVAATSPGGAISVFTYARPEWPWARKNNDVYWDDASLVPYHFQTPTPPPTPTPQPPEHWIELPTVPKNYRYIYPTPTPSGDDIQVIQNGGTFTFTTALTNAGEIEILCYFPLSATLEGGAALSPAGYFVGGLYNNRPYGYLYFDDADAQPGALFWARFAEPTPLTVHWFWVERAPGDLGGAWHGGMIEVE